MDNPEPSTSSDDAGQDVVPVYTHLNPRRQNFAFCYKMMNHIQAYWTPNVYKKLIKTCQFFFSKHKIILIEKTLFIFDEITSWDPDLDDDGEMEVWYFDPGEKVLFAEREIKNSIDVTNYKVWITGEFGWYSMDNISTFMPCVYGWNLKELALRDQTLTVHEFKIMASEKLTKLKLVNTKITASDGTELSLEDIFAVVPKIEELTYRPPSTPYTFNGKKVTAMPAMKHLTGLMLYNVRDGFDLRSFGRFYNRLLRLKWCAMKLDMNATSAFKRKLKRAAKNWLPDHDNTTDYCTFMHCTGWYLDGKNRYDGCQFALYG
uniref:Uncharacterized protein n=1 Tax=Panagrolaimus davidi TaxID=227884 RepID=A0A914PQ51_9BILA